MKIQYLYPSLKGFGYLLLLGCLVVLTVSCNNTPQNIGLPIGSTYDGGSIDIECIYPYTEELHEFEMIPEKIKLQAKMALLEYLEPDEIDRQLEFVAFKSYAESSKLKEHKLKCAYSMHYIRHIDNGVILSLGVRLIFDKDQEYKSQYGFGNLNADSPNKNYISKSTLKKILKKNNFSRYDKVALQLLPNDVPSLIFTKNAIYTKRTIFRKKIGVFKRRSVARVNLRTGEFNSKEEWRKATATNFNLLPRYGGGKRISEHMVKYQFFIDSMLQDGKTRRSASKELTMQAKYLAKKKPKEAMTLCNKAYLIDSTNADVYLCFGNILKPLNLGPNSTRPTNVTYWYETALALDSNNVDLLRFLANEESMSLVRQRDLFGYSYDESNKTKCQAIFDKAEAYYLKAIALAPKHLETMNSLAKFYTKNGKFKNAETYYFKSLELSPGDFETINDLTMMYIDKQDCKKVLAYYKKYKTHGGPRNLQRIKTFLKGCNAI